MISHLSNLQIEQICKKSESLCERNHYDNAEKLWNKLKVFGQYYTYVQKDFSFKNSKIIIRDIDLVYPIILKINHETNH